MDMQTKTGDAPVYQYRFDQNPAVKPGAMIGPLPASKAGARHAAEIQYVFETLKFEEGIPWTAADFKVSEEMASYWTEFRKDRQSQWRRLVQMAAVREPRRLSSDAFDRRRAGKPRRQRYPAARSLRISRRAYRQISRETRQTAARKKKAFCGTTNAAIEFVSTSDVRSASSRRGLCNIVRIQRSRSHRLAPVAPLELRTQSRAPAPCQGENVMTVHILTEGNMNLAYFDFKTAS